MLLTRVIKLGCGELSDPTVNRGRADSAESKGVLVSVLVCHELLKLVRW